MIPLLKRIFRTGILTEPPVERSGEMAPIDRLHDEIIAVASGKITKAERFDQRDFCIFKMNMNI